MRELDGYCTDCESHTKIHNERCSCEGEEPVAWRYRGDFIGAKLPWQHTDQKWLADRQEEDGEEVEPLYPASAISRLVKERDEAKADHEWMTANRNKWQDAATVARNRVTELEASITRLTALLAEADEVNRALLDWAEARCPCHDDKPDPCPLCGASAKPGGGHCMSAENTLPRHLLEKLRTAHRRYQQKREAK